MMPEGLISMITAALVGGTWTLAAIFWRLNSAPLYRAFIRFFTLQALGVTWLLGFELAGGDSRLRALGYRGLLLLAVSWLLVDLWRLRT